MVKGSKKIKVVVNGKLDTYVLSSIQALVGKVFNRRVEDQCSINDDRGRKRGVRVVNA